MRYLQEFAMFYSQHRMQNQVNFTTVEGNCNLFFKFTAILYSYNNIIRHNYFPRFSGGRGGFQMHDASLLMQEVQ